MIANEVESLPSQSEHETQTRIINLIRDRGGVATRVNSGSVLVKGDNGRCYRIQLATQERIMTLATYKSVSLAIEVKHSKNTATDEQISFLESVAQAGGVGLLAYDTETINEVLNRIDVYEDKFYLFVNISEPNRIFIGVK